MAISTNSPRFERANQLWASGHPEDAAREFRAMASEADYTDERAALLANEHKCYCQAGLLDKAREVMREIRKLTVEDSSVRMIIDIGDACMLTQIGSVEEGVSIFERVLRLNGEELRNPEYESLYEET